MKSPTNKSKNLISSLKRFINSYVHAGSPDRAEYYIATMYLGQGVGEYKIKIRSYTSKVTMTKTVDEICQDKLMLSKLDPMDVTRIGYLAGIEDESMVY